MVAYACIKTCTVSFNNKLIKGQVWDTTSQERYRAIASAYYRGALGAMLVYDITMCQSFEQVAHWLEELREHADKSLVVMLIGNKAKLKHQRAVSAKDAIECAEKQGLFFSETSALRRENIETSFLTMLKEIYKTVSKKTLQRNDYGRKESLMVRMGRCCR